MLHIRNLKKSSDAQWYSIRSISVKACHKDRDDGDNAATQEVVEVVSGRVAVDGVNVETIEVTAEPECSTSVRVVSSVRGSFHQGDEQFEYRGFQCMAISLVSLAKHTVDGVLSWQTEHLDRVVVLGDKLYTSLREKNMISCQSNIMCVPDLPKQSVIDGQKFDFQYGEFVNGDVNVIDGELIESGVYSTLVSGLQKMFLQYNTSSDIMWHYMCNNLSRWTVCSC